MAAPRPLLLLTADPVLGQLLPRQLAQEGEFLVEVAPTPPAAAGPAHAVLLDAALLPGPARLCARLGEAAPGRPVLLLGHAAEEAAEAPLPPGATDRLAKPVRVPELVQRLHARLATFDASPEAAVTLGPFSFHAAARLLRAGEARIRLTETEAAILSYLHRAGGRAVPREELLGEVWGYAASVATHTLETHVYRLRRKLGAAGGLLRREAGGYRLATEGDQSGPS